MTLNLDSDVSLIPFVGPQKLAALGKLEIFSVRDLLYHIPFRYNDYSLVTPIKHIRPGETVTVKGEILEIKTFVTKNGKRIVECTIFDESGSIKALWFNQQYLLKILGSGDEVSFSGTANWFGSKIVLSNPQYEILKTSGEESLHTGRVVPVYSETEGLTSKWLRSRIHFLLEHLKNNIIETLPPKILNDFDLISLSEALNSVHFPNTLNDAEIAKHRLAFDELFILHTRAKLLRAEWAKNQQAQAMLINTDQIKKFMNTLPFELTSDQQQVIEVLLSDLKQKVPMNRLVIGDVGSGKTVLATAAIYCTYLSGYSSVFMAPTQILAEQHHKTLTQLLKPFNIEVELITGATSLQSRQALATKNKKVVVGTHALLSNIDLLGEIGLVVIDEQHRFGVKQRKVLQSENKLKFTPHLLTMTATPIPRTIAKTFFGNLDVSFLNQSPRGRQKIKTWLVPNEKRQKAYTWITQEIQKNNGQVFIICPLIEASQAETLVSVKAVTQEFTELKKVFPQYEIGLLHGRMKTKEKTEILNAFRMKKYQILLATPVVEVGIDIANATIMVIEGADRFGLGALHQLRGRVGRGEKQSYCLLFTENTDENTLTRLKAMESFTSGPELAEIDLKLRGSGDLFGVRQHGVPMLKVANILDQEMMQKTAQAASIILETDPELKNLPYLRELAKKDIISESISD